MVNWMLIAFHLLASLFSMWWRGEFWRRLERSMWSWRWFWYFFPEWSWLGSRSDAWHGSSGQTVGSVTCSWDKPWRCCISETWCACADSKTSRWAYVTIFHDFSCKKMRAMICFAYSASPPLSNTWCDTLLFQHWVFDCLHLCPEMHVAGTLGTSYYTLTHNLL